MEPSPGTEESFFGAGHLFLLENVFQLDLSTFRDVFGKARVSGEKNDEQENLAFQKDDTLSANNLTMTLAPHGTIAELMESSLLSSVSENGEANSNFHICGATIKMRE